MPRASRTSERLIALFLLGVILFAPPLLLIFNKAIRILGIPALYLYLFAVWAALIALVALAVDRRHDDGESGSEMAGREQGRMTREPTDA